MNHFLANDQAAKAYFGTPEQSGELYLFELRNEDGFIEYMTHAEAVKFLVEFDDGNERWTAEDAESVLEGQSVNVGPDEDRYRVIRLDVPLWKDRTDTLQSL